MVLRWPTLFLLGFCVINSVAQDASLKSSSKLSDSKAKLAKTEYASKPADSDKLNDETDTLSPTDIGVSVPPEYANETVIKEDHHVYYNSTFYPDSDVSRHLWINLDETPNHVITHDKLSDSYRQATTVELSFEFPFYGSLLRNVTIATGGFLYMGDYLHNWIAATQYIAPLMANFDTRLSEDSVIKYTDSGTFFVVQWEKVHVQNRQSDGAFTFQVQLQQNGDIIFAYKDVPYPISSISDSHHPVKVGLSDAYILERASLFFSRKTVYEYNRIQITNVAISNNTAIHFIALPTCNTFKDCTSCISSGTKLACNWCEAVKRCSDGIDRQRQSWIQNGCTAAKTTVCPTSTESTSAGKEEVSIVTNKGTELSNVPNKISTSKTSSIYNVDDSTNSNEVLHGNEAAAHLMHGMKAIFSS